MMATASRATQIAACKSGWHCWDRWVHCIAEYIYTDKIMQLAECTTMMTLALFFLSYCHFSLPIFLIFFFHIISILLWRIFCLFALNEWNMQMFFFLLQNRSTNGLCFVDEQQRASTRSICMVCILKNFLGQFQWIYVLQIIFCFYFVEMREHSMSVLTWNVFGHKSLGINILFKLFYSGSWIAGCFVMLF